MSDRLLAGVCATALAVVTALAATPGHAAVPVPDPPARSAVGRVLGDLGDGVVEALTGGVPERGEPGPPVNGAGVVSRIRELYAQAADAERSAREASSALRSRRAATARLQRQLHAARTALERSRGDAGRIARVQYQGGSELSAQLRLLLARDPEQALEQDYLMERAAVARLAATTRLTAAEARARALAEAARAGLDAELVLAVRQEEARARAVARLRSAEALLATLSAQDVAALDAWPAPSGSPVREPAPGRGRGAAAAGRRVRSRPGTAPGRSARRPPGSSPA
ncbi:hypothetical protein EAO77_35290, partial [Streptomyces sp. t39]